MGLHPVVSRAISFYFGFSKKCVLWGGGITMTSSLSMYNFGYNRPMYVLDTMGLSILGAPWILPLSPIIVYGYYKMEEGRKSK
jgi:hypothetical protein